jgi:hypothetical protein
VQAGWTWYRKRQPLKESQITQNNSADVQLKEQQKKLLMASRQKRLMADTGKLSVLVTDLKAQVDASTTTTLPVDTIKKADEIEKLAHNLKKQLKP